MKIQQYHLTVTGYLFIAMLTVLSVACGGGGSTAKKNNNTDTQASTVFVEADAGLIVAVRISEQAVLDGSHSTATATDAMTYAWSFSSRPHGSKAELQGANSANPSFIADVTGTYMVQLVVTASGVSSQRAIASVEVTKPGEYLTGKRIHIRYPSRCADCHDGRYTNAGGYPFDPVPAKSGDHLATSNHCEACHTTFGFNVFRFNDHQEVFGNCSSCHNGVLAIGKSDTHVKTGAECDSCHTTISFLTLGPDGQFDHTDINSGCTACHDGKIAVGKHEAHMFTDSDCGYCHNKTSFKGAFIDHSNITDNCASCHNGTNGKGQTEGHPVMAVDCGICHSIKTFSLGGIYNHRLVSSDIQACSVCHNDSNSINARGKSAKPNHVPTDKDCGVCHGVGGGDFADGIYDHSETVEPCTACHGPAGNGSGPGMSANHMPIVAECDSCHTTGTFTTGWFDHDMSGYLPSTTCLTCHDGIISIGKLGSHIPTFPDNQNCADCHTTETFAGVVYDHKNIIDNCALCHDGVKAKGKQLNHMPTTRDCSDCHIVKFDDFTGASFDHFGVSNNCATCHNGVIAKGKKPNHIPSLKECSQCHIDTSKGGFAASTFLNNVHPGLSGGCEGCHSSPFFTDTSGRIKAATHVPTEQDCHFCHISTSFTPQIFSHDGITANCVSCHDGNYVVPAGALGKTPSPPHPDTTTDCGACHGIGHSFADSIFDHNGRVDNCVECHGDGMPGAVTKKHAGHLPTAQDCSICHVPGSFKTAVFNHTGIVDNCSSCHSGSVPTASTKSPNHLPTTEDCHICHNTTAFAGAKYDHKGIVKDCAYCHDGVIARGKLSNHVPTNSDCSDCHLTTGFKPASFDHLGITNNCIACHDGVFAKDKHRGHLLTNQDCSACHTTKGFFPATFNHSTVTSATRCDSCHIDGSPTRTGKDDKINPPHLATNLDCRDCHNTTTFVGGSWVHDSSTAGICDTCHRPNGDAAAKPPGHMSTDVQCDVCHTTTVWVPTSFSHSLNGNYPGKHYKPLVCSDCHGSTIAKVFVYPFEQYKPFCAACHENDFDSVDKHNGGKAGTVEQNKDCSGGGRGCHKVGDRNFN